MNQNHMDGRSPQDPSANVPQFVLPHVHLVSSYRFPHLAQLQPQTAFEYLLNAPKIVNDASPVAWTYFQAPPPDGTVLLVWQPPLMQTRFASDGYIWAEPEATYTMDIRGYTLEILVHRSGYRYGFEQISSHSRHRYRIINKNPAANIQHDPSLWIVHYTQSEPNNRFPANQIQIPPEIQRIMQERNYLEKQGQLLRKEFMLRDRLHWPEVKFSVGGPIPSAPGQTRPIFNPMQQMGAMQRPPQYYQQPQVPPVGAPPPKRLRQVPPSQMPGSTVPGMPPAAVGADTSIEDEENTALGDLLDHLTAREISVMRYTQHHEWMEEIFSSPYAAGQILPVDLGLGLMGELAPLTDGLLDAPNAESVQNNKSAPKSYHKLDPEQLKDFETRVEGYAKNEEAEIEKMKVEHSKKMADLKRSKTYIKAERRLRDAARGMPDRVDSSRSRANSTDENQARGGTPSSEAKVDSIVQGLEKSLNVTIGTKKNVVCVDKGGFIEEQVQQQVNGDALGPSISYSENGALNGLLDESAMDADNTAASLLDQYATSPAANLSLPQVSQPQGLNHSTAATPSGGIIEPAQHSSYKEQSNLEAPDEAQDLMDLDVEMAGMTNTEDKGGEGDWVIIDQAGDGQEHAGDEQELKGHEGASAEPIDSNAVPTTAVDSGATPGLFDTAEFGSFDNLDTAGDALADYTAAEDDLALDLEDSAFGDAFHGTTHHGETEDSDNV
ncbi:DUF1750-domain-containing protein [Lepidopterella palustris CBS 459.81]|uniref:DUF1750-domain-containing protein n=1 Tax=Lepidopterella palustris CBS 459.81 TaxID=1314670 RepID=A0A8E2JIA2_9PEZI|nr:DUF1750-domain-containing protein [Lepidopterella palustris CBS 459.81]